ncbi:MAG: hypothetical protein OI715_01005 (plasmid) [Candidatus Methanoperedens sp.]|nr:MAG: hypothetical protein OI715_01005 [Candidatus Methanoperedens sp.]
MAKKEKCKQIMGSLFGPATANWVDKLSEEEVVEKCKTKASALLGAEKAKVFDTI